MCSDVVLTLDDGGRTVPVTTGAVIELRLPEMPTTGFRWTVPPGDVKDGYDRPGDAPGAAATRVLRFRMPDNPLHLDLSRRQEWDPAGADHSFSVDLVPER